MPRCANANSHTHALTRNIARQYLTTRGSGVWLPAMRILRATRAALITRLGINKTLLLVRDGGPRHLAVSNVSALSAAQRSHLVSQRTQMLHNLSISVAMSWLPGRSYGRSRRALGCLAPGLSLRRPPVGGPLSWLTLTHILRCLNHTKRLEDHVPLCPYLSAAGFDAVRLLRRDDEGSDVLGEVVDCRPQCTAAYLKGACVDGLRTGWDGRRPCECNDSFPVLNCFGTQLPPWRARVRAKARCQG